MNKIHPPCAFAGAHCQRRGLTILELLVVSGMISTLAALLLPAVMSARESARRLECTSHLRQIGLALHQYHDAHNSLPAAWQLDDGRTSAYGWSTALLPHLDQSAIASDLKKSRAIGDACHTEIRSHSLEIFRCPSDVAPLQFELYQSGQQEPYLSLPTANYLGVYGTREPDDIHPTPIGDGTFVNERPIRFSSITRGLSNVIIVGERSTDVFPSSWIGFDKRDEDAECRVTGCAILGPNCQLCDECEFSSRHPGISEFLFGDGHVRGLSNSIDPKLYQQLARRQE